MLCGRDAERRVIAELVDGARRSHSGVLVLRGEAGVGKSALLDDAGEHAADMRVLLAHGVESEAQLPFAALHQLLRPVLGDLDALPAGQAGALRAALGLAEGRSADRFLVYLATLTLLAEAAERRPLLCLIDDAQWLDDASAEALVFVARRLRAEAVAMLFAVRDGDVRAFDAPALPELRLGALPDEAAAELLDRTASVHLSADVRDRLVAGTGGNPLALLELPAVLSEAQLSGAEPLIEPLPVGARVERAFLARVRGLPDATQTLLVVAAADDTGRLPVVLRAGRRLGIDDDALDAAERAGLLRTDGELLQLRPPLVPSAVYQAAARSQRRAAHGALADVLDGDEELDRRAWHRAEASVEPDPSVVEELEQAARRAQGQSAFATASRAFERAAALSEDRAARLRRLTAAVESAWWAGRLARVSVLLERAVPLAGAPLARAELARWKGLLELTGGAPDDAYDVLTRAADEVAALDPDRALYLLSIASVAASFAGDEDAGRVIAARVERLPVAPTPHSRLLVEVLAGLGAHYRADHVTAARRLRAALELSERAPEDDPARLLFAGRAALFLADDEATNRIHRLAATRARTSGTLGILPQILPRLAHAELWAGRWSSAEAHATEGRDLAREVGQDTVAAHLIAVLALVAALRGDEEACRAHSAQSLELATAHRLAHVADCAHWALLLLELGHGRAHEALGHAREVANSPAVLWTGPDRIEAAVRAGDPATARAWLDPFSAWAQATDSPWPPAATAHCRALLADDPAEAELLFGAAVGAPRGCGRPFERARTELAFGERLRRDRHRVQAREHLRAALDGFEAVGAATWAERARVELRSSGQTARRRDPGTLDRLTAQERQIAGLVAQGRTNRDVAGQLFLSPRTVDFHLRNVFRKLGISSRAELARLDLDGAPRARDRAA